MTLESASSSSGGIFDAPRKRERLAELDHLSADPTLWNDQERAQLLLQERTQISALFERLSGLEERLDEADILVEMAAEEEDLESLEEAEAQAKAAQAGLRRMELERMLSGPHDPANCFLNINAGAGGTESQDWAEMILRMLLRYCESQGWKTEITEFREGEEAGLKSATFKVSGAFSFGYLKAENGVHRLIRISPFDSQKRRHTSFASVSVLPELDDDIEIEVLESELRVDRYRSSGAGGQHVNKTDSAVRLTHLPTGIVVACQAERSQHKNRATAMKLLKAKLYDLEMSKRSAERDQLYAGRSKIDFGSQIRNYVLHPFRMVKDLRSQYKTSNAQAVLDGDLDDLIEAFLLARAEGGAS